MVVNKNLHFLLVTFPAHGHINPSLEFSKRLIGRGAQVTLVTTVYGHRRMIKNSSVPDGLTLAPFSDGFDDGFKNTNDFNYYMSQFRCRGSEYLTNLVLDHAKLGSSVTFLVYTPLIPWAAQVASDFEIPSALLWIQPAMVFDIYYYYFNGYRDVIASNDDDPSYSIELPGLPVLTCLDIPSFFLPPKSNPYAFFLDSFQEQFQLLEEERAKKKSPLRVFVNTFDALESQALTAIDKLELIGIGPLVPSAFLDSKNSCDRGDSPNGSKEHYVEWLNSQKASSVVYISFGTIFVIGKQQTEEIGRAFLASGRPFLWIIRTTDENDANKEEEETMVNLVKGLEGQGLIVPWCSQMEVLTHPSIGCFITHCGWNSTLECMAAGVPVVAFPQWSDQATNAKLIEDVCKTGVRVKVKEEDRLLHGEELNKCLDMVMDAGGGEMRMNAKKWKDLARKAVDDGGSSDINLLSFLEDLRQGCC